MVETSSTTPRDIEQGKDPPLSHARRRAEAARHWYLGRRTRCGAGVGCAAGAGLRRRMKARARLRAQGRRQDAQRDAAQPIDLRRELLSWRRPEQRRVACHCRLLLAGAWRPPAPGRLRMAAYCGPPIADRPLLAASVYGLKVVGSTLSRYGALAAAPRHAS